MCYFDAHEAYDKVPGEVAKIDSDGTVTVNYDTMVGNFGWGEHSGQEVELIDGSGPHGDGEPVVEEGGAPKVEAAHVLVATDLLSQNSKMKQSSIPGTYNFGIPAWRAAAGKAGDQKGPFTCPGAGACAKGCFAQDGMFKTPGVQNAYEWRYEQTKDPKKFVELLEAEIKAHPNMQALRVHDSGDFYSKEYLNTWLEIAASHPKIHFYAYTKSLPWVKEAQKEGKVPANFTINFSYGGKYDHLIDPEVDRHAKVFKNKEDLEAAGYTDASLDDAVAAKGKANKIGLVFHSTAGGKKGAKEWGIETPTKEDAANHAAEQEKYVKELKEKQAADKAAKKAGKGGAIAEPEVKASKEASAKLPKDWRDVSTSEEEKYEFLAPAGNGLGVVWQFKPELDDKGNKVTWEERWHWAIKRGPQRADGTAKSLKDAMAVVEDPNGKGGKKAIRAEKVKCDTCGKSVDVDKGEAFFTDDDGIYCADHYPIEDIVADGEMVRGGREDDYYQAFAVIEGVVGGKKGWDGWEGQLKKMLLNKSFSFNGENYDIYDDGLDPFTVASNLYDDVNSEETTGDFRAAFEDAVNEAIDAFNAWEKEFYSQRADGTAKSLKDAMAVVEDPNGKGGKKAIRAEAAANEQDCASLDEAKKLVGFDAKTDSENHSEDPENPSDKIVILLRDGKKLGVFSETRKKLVRGVYVGEKK
jgi:hypothetical protein